MTKFRTTLIFIAITSLGACIADYGSQSEYALANLNYEEGSKYGLSPLVRVNTNKWQVHCWSREVSTTGEVRGRDYCTLDRGGVGVFGIVEWHRNGPTLASHASDELCNAGAVAFGVDGQSLRGLSFARQYAMLSQGRLYASDSRSNWPECATRTSYYSLAGFADAFQELRQKAQERGFALAGF